MSGIALLLAAPVTLALSSRLLLANVVHTGGQPAAIGLDRAFR